MEVVSWTSVAVFECIILCQLSFVYIFVTVSDICCSFLLIIYSVFACSVLLVFRPMHGV